MARGAEFCRKSLFCMHIPPNLGLNLAMSRHVDPPTASPKGAIPRQMPKLAERFAAGLAVEDGRKKPLLFDTVCPGLRVRGMAKAARTFSRMDRCGDTAQGAGAYWLVG